MKNYPSEYTYCAATVLIVLDDALLFLGDRPKSIGDEQGVLVISPSPCHPLSVGFYSMEGVCLVGSMQRLLRLERKEEMVLEKGIGASRLIKILILK